MWIGNGFHVCLLFSISITFNLISDIRAAWHGDCGERSFRFQRNWDRYARVWLRMCVCVHLWKLVNPVIGHRKKWIHNTPLPESVLSLSPFHWMLKMPTRLPACQPASQPACFRKLWLRWRRNYLKTFAKCVNSHEETLIYGIHRLWSWIPPSLPTNSNLAANTYAFITAQAVLVHSQIFGTNQTKPNRCEPNQTNTEPNRADAMRCEPNQTYSQTKPSQRQHQQRLQQKPNLTRKKKYITNIFITFS